MFEKSATELKLKQKLLKCKSTIQIATFNLRTLNRIGQLPELTASAIDHNIDIICIQKHRYIYSEDIKHHDIGNGWTFVSASAWKNSVNATIGVGMLIGPRAQKSLNSIEKIQPRMMVATFNGNPSTKIISCYSPTNVSEETDLIAFYNVNHKFSLLNSSNRNGEHLIDFTLENRLTWLNTKFQKRKGKLWTHTYTNNTKAQIDYAFINKKWNNSALNCEACLPITELSRLRYDWAQEGMRP